MKTGKRIKALRKKRDMSQEQLAAKANVTHATVSRLECGKHEGTMRTLRKLADALGVEVEDVIGSPG